MGIVSLILVFAEIYALSSNDIKVGTSLEVDGAPWKVLGNFDSTQFPYIFHFFQFLVNGYLYLDNVLVIKP